MDIVSAKEVAIFFPALEADVLHQDGTSPCFPPRHVDAIPLRWHGAISHGVLA